MVAVLPVSSVTTSLLLRGSSFMVTVLPFSSVTVMVFVSGSTFIVETLPLFLSLTTMVPEESSLETVSRSGLVATDSLATASTGFFFIRSGSSPACFTLCTTKNPIEATAITTKTNSPAKMPTIQRMILPAPLLAGAAAGGTPAGGCGLTDGVVDIEISFDDWDRCEENEGDIIRGKDAKPNVD